MGKHKKQVESAAGKHGGKGKGTSTEKENLDELLKQLELGTQKKEPQEPIVSNQEAKARRKKKAQQIRESKTETLSEEEILKKLEQQRQHAQLQQILRLLQMQQQQSGGPSEILDQPVRTKDPLESVQDNVVTAAVCGMQGWRRSMEDAHCIALDVCPESSRGDNKHRLFAVFDGHAGPKTAQYASTALLKMLSQNETLKKSSTDPEKYKTMFKESYLQLDKELRDGKHDGGSGSTACSVLITPDAQLVCANVGDSRAVLCRQNGEIVELSSDHKPSLPLEHERIESAGGFVSMNRVNGQLAMSRALGDFTYKQNTKLEATQQQVISLPDVEVVQLHPQGVKDRFVIIACDGVWDVLSSAEAVAFVSTKLGEGKSLQETVEALVDHCCCDVNPSGHGPAQSIGTDNVTAILVSFN